MSPGIMSLLRDPLPGSTVGGYRVLTRTGTGSLSDVYSAKKEPSGNQPLALKILKPAVMEQPGAEVHSRRFVEEVSLLASLKHPSFVRVLESGVHPGPPARPWVATEFLSGAGLAETVRASSMSWRRACRFTAVLAAAVQELSERGVVLGDLGPSNIIVQRTPGRTLFPRLFDLSHASSRELPGLMLTGTAALSFAGTVPFSAPELVFEPTPASDVFSLGAILYFCCTGRPPYSRAQWPRVSGEDFLPETPLRAINGAIPEQVDALVRQCLSLEPARRPQTAADLAARLTVLAEAGGSTARLLGELFRSLTKRWR